MKKYFQMFIDEGSENSIPLRIDPDHIYGYKKFGVSQTIVFTKIGAYTVCEDFENFSARLFKFVNKPFTVSENSEEKDSSNNKKLIVKRKVSKINQDVVEESYFDKHQPDTNY